MKKLMILVCAILCVGQLYSMDQQAQPSWWTKLQEIFSKPGQQTNVQDQVNLQSLPKEVVNIITSNNIDGAIQEVKSLSTTNPRLSEIIANRGSTFWVLVTLLAVKFQKNTAEGRLYIARSLNPQVSESYAYKIQEFFVSPQTQK